MDLLREADSINLSPEILEPEAQSIGKVCAPIHIHISFFLQSVFHFKQHMCSVDFFGSLQV